MKCALRQHTPARQASSAGLCVTLEVHGMGCAHNAVCGVAEASAAAEVTACECWRPKMLPSRTGSRRTAYTTAETSVGTVPCPTPASIPARLQQASSQWAVVTTELCALFKPCTVIAGHCCWVHPLLQRHSSSLQIRASLPGRTLRYIQSRLYWCAFVRPPIALHGEAQAVRRAF